MIAAQSGLGDELNHVPVDKHTFVHADYDNILPSAMQQRCRHPKLVRSPISRIETWTENFLRYIDGLEMTHQFDGHANCYIESGFGKGI